MTDRDSEIETARLDGYDIARRLFWLELYRFGKQRWPNGVSGRIFQFREYVGIMLDDYDGKKTYVEMFGADQD